MACRRSRTISLALLLTLCGTLASAGETTPPDGLPPAEAGLADLVEARAGAGHRWPQARLQLQQILADRLRLQAALRDTVSVLTYRHRFELAAAAAEGDSLRAATRWLTWDLEAAHDRRQRWWQSPTVVVPVTVLATLYAVDVVVRR